MAAKRSNRYGYAFSFLRDHERVLTDLAEAGVFGSLLKSVALEQVLRAGLGVFQPYEIENGKVSYAWRGRSHRVMRYMLPPDVIDMLDKHEEAGLTCSFLMNRLFEEGLDVVVAQNPDAARVVAARQVHQMDAAPGHVREKATRVILRRLPSQPSARPRGV